MKFKTTIPAILALILSGCAEKTYDVISNGLYINESAPYDKYNQQVENLTVTGDMTVSINIRLAQTLDQDVHATLDIAEDFANEYNAKNNTGYKVLPSEYLSFNKDVTIPAGNLSSDPVVISIKEFPSGGGESYCIPIRIASTDAPVGIMEASSRIMYLITTPLKQKVPVMNSGTMPTGSGGWNIATSEWTLEGWVWMSSYSINNQAIFSATVSKGTEIYVRFGDANVEYDKLQIKTGGSQFNSNKTFSPNTWYHIAITYANGKCRLYIDGEEDSSMDVSTDYVIENLSLCSSGSYFRATAMMAQVRFWKKALSATVIRDAKNRAVPVDSDGLFGYWKLDEGSGDVFNDATSNGYDLECSKAPGWSEEEVNFFEPNKKE